MDSSSSSSDLSGATAEEIEGEDAETGAAETVSGADDLQYTLAPLTRMPLQVFLLGKRMWKQGTVLKMMRCPWMN